MANKDDILVHERLTRVETALEAHIIGEEEQLREVLTEISAINKELSRYRGFIGGVLFVVTALVTFVKMYGEAVAKFVRG